MSAPLCPSNSTSAQRSPHILLRSSWQAVNIGDIGHTPGVLHLLEMYFPEARVTLWTNLEDERALQERFPQVELIRGELDEAGTHSNPDLQRIFREADFLLHGSGPGIVARDDLVAWSAMTGKPYGIFGVTVDPLTIPAEDERGPGEGGSLAEQQKQVDGLPSSDLSEKLRRILNGAEFVLCRDSLSLRYLRSQDLSCEVLDFTPDGAFEIDLREEEESERFLVGNQLESGRFLAVIPRLRYTPYHKIHRRTPTGRDLRGAKVSERYRKHDFDLMREVVIRWVRETGRKVLICPEMTYQVELGREEIVDRLPDDVRSSVVWLPYFWSPGMACSVYARSEAVLSMDNHSPIFALSVGVPTIFLRHATDTIKGQMWPDIGMDDWFFEMDETSSDEVVECLLKIHQDRESALRFVNEIMVRVREGHRQSMAIVREKVLESSTAAPVENHQNV
ncbi:polysaccharide pyruvyl transferase family protein [Puniceicoccus vermicola]|uniref:Polysaccharide pyruvyl transferase family protein n=1 Tax=Puniceicoccus vermicola TaxID=388746 RepID=A0A7X1E569_9BACT|nr:polysaccharide pyruvyl transferase family protein [Puniceicoccus vermicola]MBC2602733.1 polysaccharide pyruvyl transferase family protein [Puniceicoccus vermicola]